MNSGLSRRLSMNTTRASLFLAYICISGCSKPSADDALAKLIFQAPTGVDDFVALGGTRTVSARRCNVSIAAEDNVSYSMDFSAPFTVSSAPWQGSDGKQYLTVSIRSEGGMFKEVHFEGSRKMTSNGLSLHYLVDESNSQEKIMAQIKQFQQICPPK